MGSLAAPTTHSNALFPTLHVAKFALPVWGGGGGVLAVHSDVVAKGKKSQSRLKLRLYRT